MKKFIVKTEYGTYIHDFPSSIDATIWAIEQGCTNIVVTLL